MYSQNVLKWGWRQSNLILISGKWYGTNKSFDCWKSKLFYCLLLIITTIITIPKDVHWKLPNHIYFSVTDLSYLFPLTKLQLSSSSVSRLQPVLLQKLRVLLLLLFLTLSLSLQGTLSSLLVLLIYLFIVCVFRAAKRGFCLFSLWLQWHIVCLTCDSSFSFKFASSRCCRCSLCLFVAVLLFDSFVFCCLRRRRCLLYLHLWVSW